MVMGARRAMRRAAAPIQPASRAVRRLVGRQGKEIWSWMKRTLTSRGSTLSMASAFIIAVAVLTFSAFRMTAGAAHSQSRCPTDLASDGRRPFGVLVDSIGSSAQGSDVNVHFDVCGLNEGAPAGPRAPGCSAVFRPERDPASHASRGGERGHRCDRPDQGEPADGPLHTSTRHHDARRRDAARGQLPPNGCRHRRPRASPRHGPAAPHRQPVVGWRPIKTEATRSVCAGDALDAVAPRREPPISS